MPLEHSSHLPSSVDESTLAQSYEMKKQEQIKLGAAHWEYFGGVSAKHVPLQKSSIYRVVITVRIYF